ncbi:GNAT family N-acetyltransferase [Virgibacillus flavescens]|uniref:GNAT family N-acetyltransferase n=1 Tax=Virgibacillus flavescens TaxID=1611422 RepID=UPI003D3357FE
MLITLEKISKDDEKVLQNLMQYYIYEFSRYITEIKLEENGAYDPFNLEKYCEEPNFHAYLIKLGEELIGFVLVESEAEECPNTIHEFFIIAKYEGKGFGKEAAHQIFKWFPGKWKLTQIEKNYRAQAFWRSLIFKLTDGNVTERYGENRLSIQEFHTDSFIK